MPSYINSIKPIKQIDLPKLKLIETDSVPKKSQSLKEWAMAGGGVPESHKDRADVWHKKARNYAAGGAVHMQKGGKMGVGMKIADAVADVSKQADEILAAKKANSKLEDAMKSKQAPMTSPQGTGLPLMPRSQGMYTPGVKQEDLPRMTKVDKARAEGKSPAYTERMQDLLDSPTARKKVDKLINKGKELNVQEWYGTEPLRQVAMDAGLSPDEFNTLIAQLASASQRNPVDQQNKMGSYLHYLSKTGQLPDDAFLLTNKIKRGKQEMPEGTPIELPSGYGSLAQLAMTAETRGQNSVVNYTPLNAKLKAEVSQLREIQMEAKRRGDTQRYNLATEGIKDAFQGFQYAPQKAILLPPEYLNADYRGGMPDYVRKLIKPEKGTETQSVLTHYSNRPDLEFTDPRRYGTGIKGAEAERLSDPSAVRDRSYFYMGEPGTVSAEPGLGVNRYRGEASSLYDITQDPLDFRVLARESNRTPYTSKYNQGITSPLQDANDMERLVREYGYQGMANPKASKPMAIMFDQTPVQRKKRGGLASIK